MSIASGYRVPITPPPLQDPIPLSEPVKGQRGFSGNLGKVLSFLRSVSWASWFSSLTAQFAQIYVVGEIDFPNTAAQTSSAELTITFTIGGPNGPFAVPYDSFIVCMRVLDPATDLPVDQPVNSFFTYRFLSDGRIGIRFNNYSAGAIDPPAYKFEFLVQLRAQTNA